jgi:hypothetical protein
LGGLKGEGCISLVEGTHERARRRFLISQRALREAASSDPLRGHDAPRWESNRADHHFADRVRSRELTSIRDAASALRPDFARRTGDGRSRNRSASAQATGRQPGGLGASSDKIPVTARLLALGHSAILENKVKRTE